MAKNVLYEAKHAIIGMGQIGTGLLGALGRHVDITGYDVEAKDLDLDFDVLHIAIPFDDNFVDAVKGYKEQFNAELVIIYSTTAIGTVKKLGDGYVHSPIEGKHPYLGKSIKISSRWLGSTDSRALTMAATLWGNIVDDVRMVEDSDFTEFIKLRSTSRFGINLDFARYEKSVADKLGMNWNYLMQYDRDYNKLYQDLGLSDMQRYVLTPPPEVLGGHCVGPNADILNEQFPNQRLESVK